MLHLKNQRKKWKIKLVIFLNNWEIKFCLIILNDQKNLSIRRSSSFLVYVNCKRLCKTFQILSLFICFAVLLSDDKQKLIQIHAFRACILSSRSISLSHFMHILYTPWFSCQDSVTSVSPKIAGLKPLQVTS